MGFDEEHGASEEDGVGFSLEWGGAIAVVWVVRGRDEGGGGEVDVEVEVQRRRRKGRD